MKPKTVLAVMVIAAQAALAGYIALWGPTTPIPMHFDWNGGVNRWGSRGEAALVVGGMACLSVILLLGLGQLSQRKGSPDDPRRLSQAHILGLGLTTATCGLVAAMTFGWMAQGDSSPRLQMAFLCAIFLFLGAYLGKVTPNALVGVRTPWTFGSRLAWEKSNRLAGRLFFWGGIVGLIAATFAPQPLGLHATLIGILVAGAASVAESWRVWRSDPDRTGWG